MTQRAAFTLVELMVVIGILLILGSMLSSVIALAMRAGAKANTQAIMQNTATAIRAFQADTGVLPWQRHDPLAFPQLNALQRILGSDLTATERGALASDLAAVGLAYTSAPQQFLAAHVSNAVSTNAEMKGVFAGALNRLAAERGRNAILAGNTTVTGAYTSPLPILASPASSGWQADYLLGSISANDRSGATILDAYGRPLVYICPVTKGVRGFKLSSLMSSDDNYADLPVDADAYGLATTGRTATTTMASDLLTQASDRMRNDFELWSAGPDGRISANRADPVNRDNIPLSSAYLAGLQ